METGRNRNEETKTRKNKVEIVMWNPFRKRTESELLQKEIDNYFNNTLKNELVYEWYKNDNIWKGLLSLQTKYKLAVRKEKLQKIKSKL